MTQMLYLNKALDVFNTAIVSPVYYVMFTSCTIVVSTILFQNQQETRAAVTELCGFATIVSGTFLLHTTKDFDVAAGQVLDSRRTLDAANVDCGSEVTALRIDDSSAAIRTSGLLEKPKRQW
jgi:hypothetical protein